MKKQKRLTAENNKQAEAPQSNKKLTGESGTAKPEASEVRLVGDDKPSATTETSPEQTPHGATLNERIQNSTLAGGLKKIPDGFDDNDGDWQVINSPNFFERLYLDVQSYQKITPEMVESNYQILKAFWQQKISIMHTGANKIKIIRKYAGPGGSERTVTLFPKQLDEALMRLSAPNGIETYYFELQETRQREIQEKVDPMFALALKDKVLEPAEEVEIRNFCRNHSDLSEAEIDELIEKYLKETGSTRGQGGSGVSEAERILFYQIKKKLSDKLLATEEESDLLEDLEEYKISNERYEELVRQALREIDGSERQNTLDQDKIIFSSFYFSLLRDHSLSANDELPEAAKEKLMHRDSSQTEFFPLSQSTRKLLIQETTQRYKQELQAEKEKFYEEAVSKLDYYDGHIEAAQKMRQDKTYVLLLPKMRDEIIEKTKEEFIEQQTSTFTQAVKKYFQIQKWSISEDESERFVAVPDQLPHTKELRYDWLDKDQRMVLFDEVTQWAAEQHQQEIFLIRERISSELKQYIYGLPVPLQLEIENDSGYYLSIKERQNIFVELEKKSRLKAEKLFHRRVKKALVFGTLIPEVEEKLLKTGQEELLLTAEKNEKSFSVKTAPEIIENHRFSFRKVMTEQVQKIAEEKRLDDKIILEYNLDYQAYISRKDFDAFLDQFQPADKKERKTIETVFKEFTKDTGLYITSPKSAQDFDGILEDAMAKTSSSYRFGLRRWLTPDFEKNMIKLGAAYGVDQQAVEVKISEIRSQYSKWTLPKWSRFFIWFFTIVGGTALIRAIFSIFGYQELIFVGGPLEPIQKPDYLSWLNFEQAVILSQNEYLWLPLSVIFFVLLFLILVPGIRTVKKY